VVTPPRQDQARRKAAAAARTHKQCKHEWQSWPRLVNDVNDTSPQGKYAFIYGHAVWYLAQNAKQGAALVGRQATYLLVPYGRIAVHSRRSLPLAPEMHLHKHTQAAAAAVGIWAIPCHESRTWVLTAVWPKDGCWVAVSCLHAATPALRRLAAIEAVCAA
jgi:hypothetical protein